MALAKAREKNRRKPSTLVKKAKKASKIKVPKTRVIVPVLKRPAMAAQVYKRPAAAYDVLKRPAGKSTAIVARGVLKRPAMGSKRHDSFCPSSPPRRGTNKLAFGKSPTLPASFAVPYSVAMGDMELSGINEVLPEIMASILGGPPKDPVPPAPKSWSTQREPDARVAARARAASPMPVRRRSPTPVRRARSPSPPKRRRSPTPKRRERKRSPTPPVRRERKRSPTPPVRREKKRSPTPKRRRGPPQSVKPPSVGLFDDVIEDPNFCGGELQPGDGQRQPTGGGADRTLRRKSSTPADVWSQSASTGVAAQEDEAAAPSAPSSAAQKKERVSVVPPVPRATDPESSSTAASSAPRPSWPTPSASKPPADTPASGHMQPAAPPPSHCSAATPARKDEALVVAKRVKNVRKEFYASKVEWAFAVLEKPVRDLHGVQKAYRNIMKSLHPDRAGESMALVADAVEVVREAKDLCERQLRRQDPPERPTRVRYTHLCEEAGRRRFRVQWKPPDSLPSSPVHRYVVAVVDPSFGKALSVATLEPDYSQEMRRYLPYDDPELCSYVISEEELRKMPNLFNRSPVVVQVAAGNNEGQSDWSILKVDFKNTRKVACPKSSPRRDSIGGGAAADKAPGRASVAGRSSVGGRPSVGASDVSEFDRTVAEKKGHELENWLRFQKKEDMQRWLKQRYQQISGSKETAIQRIITYKENSGLP